VSAAALLDASALAIAAAVSKGAVSAREIAQEALNRIEAQNGALGAFTDVTAKRALARADVLDKARARGESLGPLAGAPFAAKNLFDVAGLPTRAGSKINRDRPPAGVDATVVSRLEAAGGVLVGALNMGEFAYDFTGENAHDGPSRNPHDLEHMTGGSSGGSGAAVAGGLVPIALGSDTNGSIRVPSSFCGLFGLKPTYGRLSRAGAFPFVASLDHVGPLARSTGDLALSYDAMLGRDHRDPAQAEVTPAPASPALKDGVGGLRIARLGGYFARTLEESAIFAVDTVARALNAGRVVELTGAEQARSAAYLITMAEGAALHLERLRTRAKDFDPDVRNRLTAGAMLPGAWITQAQKFRRRFHAEALALFREVDILLAPATPCRAPRIGQKAFVLDGREMLVRPNIGLFTQPLSFIGLPVVTAPVWTDGEKLPIGVQIIAAPWREDLALRVGWALERDGIARAPVATLT
jgi:aspartyl-tRNA(Asn)/glutamyl-tRNA(Gln) amidotransferase subunit A